jgi:hypothetical protein
MGKTRRGRFSFPAAPSPDCGLLGCVPRTGQLAPLSQSKAIPMGTLIAILVPIIIVVVVGLIIIWVAERFSPDPLITKIIKVIVFAVVLIAIITKLLPLLR